MGHIYFVFGLGSIVNLVCLLFCQPIANQCREGLRIVSYVFFKVTGVHYMGEAVRCELQETRVLVQLGRKVTFFLTHPTPLKRQFCPKVQTATKNSTDLRPIQV